MKTHGVPSASEKFGQPKAPASNTPGGISDRMGQSIFVILPREPVGESNKAPTMNPTQNEPATVNRRKFKIDHKQVRRGSQPVTYLGVEIRALCGNGILQPSFLP